MVAATPAGGAGLVSAMAGALVGSDSFRPTVQVVWGTAAVISLSSLCLLLTAGSVKPGDTAFTAPMSRSDLLECDDWITYLVGIRFLEYGMFSLCP